MSATVFRIRNSVYEVIDKNARAVDTCTTGGGYTPNMLEHVTALIINVIAMVIVIFVILINKKHNHLGPNACPQVAKRTKKGKDKKSKRMQKVRNCSIAIINLVIVSVFPCSFPCALSSH